MVWNNIFLCRIFHLKILIFTNIHLNKHFVLKVNFDTLPEFETAQYTYKVRSW